MRQNPLDLAPAPAVSWIQILEEDGRSNIYLEQQSRTVGLAECGSQPVFWASPAFTVSALRCPRLLEELEQFPKHAMLQQRIERSQIGAHLTFRVSFVSWFKEQKPKILCFYEGWMEDRMMCGHKSIPKSVVLSRFLESDSHTTCIEVKFNFPNFLYIFFLNLFSAPLPYAKELD